MKVYFLDHYDSFSSNVIDWLSKHRDCKELICLFSDDKNLLSYDYSDCCLVLSPGPNAPKDVPQTVKLVVRELGKTPILGICLGHQILGHVAGFEISCSQKPLHGLSRLLSINEKSGIFRGSEDELVMASYHSLTCKGQARLPWRVSARSEIGEIQAIERLKNGEAPAVGLQFHPESFLSQNSEALLNRWFEMVDDWQQEKSQQGFKLCSRHLYQDLHNTPL